MMSRKSTSRIAAAIAACCFLAAAPAHSERIVAAHFGQDIACSPLAVAMELGLFKKHGADITEILTSDGGSTTLRNMLAGRVPYGEVGPNAVLSAIREGIAVKIVAANSIQLSDMAWVVPKDSPLKEPKDLIGKKIAVTSPKSVSKAILDMSLEGAGVRPDQVTITPLGAIGAGLTALDAGGVQAAFINEPLWSARDDRYRIIIKPSEYVKNYTQNVGVATDEAISRQPDLLKGILAARREAIDYIYANPEEAAKLITKRYYDALPLEVATKALKRAVSLRFWSRGDIDMAGLKEVANVMVKQGDWQGPVDWIKVVDQSLLPADLPKVELPKN